MITWSHDELNRRAREYFEWLGEKVLSVTISTNDDTGGRNTIAIVCEGNITYFYEIERFMQL
jgi:hypothetical protein